ncbi:hypothetical protein UY3_16357 [Chelonia mydas]|uniref:Uncharacterized protein n=1 Tax=Chelonia mydas TaxID=8469 RepID=M7BEC7_CHEMY|nr:hypothetical protein UY3_16357 [Chelonia mydas]
MVGGATSAVPPPPTLLEVLRLDRKYKRTARSSSGAGAPEGADGSSRELGSQQDLKRGFERSCVLQPEETNKCPEELPGPPSDECPEELWGLPAAEYPEETEDLWTAEPYAQTGEGSSPGEPDSGPVLLPESKVTSLALSQSSIALDLSPLSDGCDIIRKVQEKRGQTCHTGDRLPRAGKQREGKGDGYDKNEICALTRSNRLFSHKQKMFSWSVANDLDSDFKTF